jgi:hypothetical protein
MSLKMMIISPVAGGLGIALRGVIKPIRRRNPPSRHIEERS